MLPPLTSSCAYVLVDNINSNIVNVIDVIALGVSACVTVQKTERLRLNATRGKPSVTFIMTSTQRASMPTI